MRLGRSGAVGRGLSAIAVLAVLTGLTSCDRSTIGPSELRIGDCFDVPDSAASFSALRRLPCSEAHSGEVFHIFDATAAAGPTYPTDAEWGTLIYPVCDPPFDEWTGAEIGTSISVRYRFLVPTKDEWSRGSHQVTCFLSRTDGAKLLGSLHVTPRPTG
jgi:hypothetical protein